MASNEDLLRLLSALPSGDILGLLDRNTLLRLAEQFYTVLGLPSPRSNAESSVSTPDDASNAGPSQGASANAPIDRAKRPLNAFMAFRTYYLKLFPEVQQKSVSGFLTTLWSKDPNRNKWALIAKVYSFVRDDIGKNRVSLGHFLKLACPIMKILDPALYLQSLGWSLRESHDGVKLFQDTGASNHMAHLQMEACPDTDIALMASLVNAGYLPDVGRRLLSRMSENSSSMMTTSGPAQPPAPYTPEKLQFIMTVRSDPLQASRDILRGLDEDVANRGGLVRHYVDNVANMRHIHMQPVYPDPAAYYNYSTNNLASNPRNSFSPEHVSENEPLHVSNPFDMDAAMGHSEPEGERPPAAHQGPEYNSHSDFHYTF